MWGLQNFDEQDCSITCQQVLTNRISSQLLDTPTAVSWVEQSQDLIAAGFVNSPSLTLYDTASVTSFFNGKGTNRHLN